MSDSGDTDSQGSNFAPLSAEKLRRLIKKVAVLKDRITKMLMKYWRIRDKLREGATIV